jgi:(S)-ureidoglycine aminohydrolase
MQQLGHSRSVRQPDHLLLTPDTFVRAPLPGMQNATAAVHVSPAMGPTICEPEHSDSFMLWKES